MLLLLDLLEPESILLLLVGFGWIVDICFFVFLEEVQVLSDAIDGLSVTVLGSVISWRDPFEWWTGGEEGEEPAGEFICHYGDSDSLCAVVADGVGGMDNKESGVEWKVFKSYVRSRVRNITCLGVWRVLFSHIWIRRYFTSKLHAGSEDN